ncbi:hypothetical protein D3C84_987710 [compost metagenome]
MEIRHRVPNHAVGLSPHHRADRPGIKQLSLMIHAHQFRRAGSATSRQVHDFRQRILVLLERQMISRIEANSRKIVVRLVRIYYHHGTERWHSRADRIQLIPDARAVLMVTSD